MAEVILKNVKKDYGETEAVLDFNLEILPGEFVVLVGPSGCGKTTTLRMIAGLEEITHGDIYIGNNRVNDLEPKDRNISMVFQNYALYPHMNVRENIGFPLKLKKLSKAEIKIRVDEVAKMLGITELMERKPKSLSGGEKQRVAIGRAIVREPKVILMDEPLSNLDAKLRNQMRTELVKLRHRINSTFIYVTHDQTEAMTLGDRIVVMKDGIIQQVGTPMEVYNHPANTFVAGFIGMPQMNFFNAKLVKMNGKFQVDLSGITIELSEERRSLFAGQACDEGCARNIIVGIRPENLILSKTKGRCLRGKIDVIEMMGGSYHIHVSDESNADSKMFIGDKTLSGKSAAAGNEMNEGSDKSDTVIIIPSIDIERDDDLIPGQTITYELSEKKILLFDAETGINFEMSVSKETMPEG